MSEPVRPDKVPAINLHLRPYTESSALIELFTLPYGRLTTIAKGIKRPKSPLAPAKLLFQSLEVSFVGRSDLKTLIQVDVIQSAYLTGEASMVAMTAANWLLRLTDIYVADHTLFYALNALLTGLEPYDRNRATTLLRRFEWALCQHVGMGIDWLVDAYTGDKVDTDGLYGFHPEIGVFTLDATPNTAQLTLTGLDLHAFAALTFDNLSIAQHQTLKQLFRLLLSNAAKQLGQQRRLKQTGLISV